MKTKGRRQSKNVENVSGKKGQFAKVLQEARWLNALLGDKSEPKAERLNPMGASSVKGMKKISSVQNSKTVRSKQEEAAEERWKGKKSRVKPSDSKKKQDRLKGKK